MQLKLGEAYFYWGTSLPPDDAILSGLAAYKQKYNGALPRVVFCNPAVLPTVENPPVGLATNENLNSHVYAFELPRNNND